MDGNSRLSAGRDDPRRRSGATAGPCRGRLSAADAPWGQDLRATQRRRGGHRFIQDRLSISNPSRRSSPPRRAPCMSACTPTTANHTNCPSPYRPHCADWWPSTVKALPATKAISVKSPNGSATRCLPAGSRQTINTAKTAARCTVEGGRPTADGLSMASGQPSRIIDLVISVVRQPDGFRAGGLTDVSAGNDSNAGVNVVAASA